MRQYRSALLSILLILALLSSMIVPVVSGQPDPGWGVPVQVSSPAGSDSANFGAALTATAGFDPVFDAPLPPNPPGEVDHQSLYFYYPSNPAGVQKLAASKVAISDSMSWPLQLAYMGSEPGTATISWDRAAVAAVPGNYAFTFSDGIRTVSMAEVGFFADFDVTPGATYDFVISASRDVTAPPAPTLVSPANNAIITSGAPNFRWSTVSDPSGVTYRLQVSRNSDFSTPVINAAGLRDPLYVAMGTAFTDTAYYWRVRARDGSGNTGPWSASWAFRVDATAPTISDVTAFNITTSSAIIVWNTSEPATDQVQYGLTTAYGSSQPATAPDHTNPANLVMGHAVSLNGLATNTTYHYRVKSKDSQGIEAVSGDFTFTTAADQTPPVISRIDAINETANGAFVIWSTNEPATSQVEYGTTTAYGSKKPLAAPNHTDPANLSANHNIGLTGLIPGTEYHYRVRSKDAAGNESVSGDNTFTTLGDSTPPTIGTVRATLIREQGATILWSTNEPSTSQVEYGTTTALGSSTTLDTAPATGHNVVLSGLTPGTLYYFVVKSRDSAGNEAVSTPLQTFTTLSDSIAPVVSNVTAVNITLNSATVLWATNEPATSQVEFGLDTSYGSSVPAAAPDHANPANLRTAHSITLGSLLQGATYHYRVHSKDAYGNEQVSPDYSFTTAADTTAPIISDVAASNITINSAVIRWNTNERSNSRVEYGLTTAYGASTLLNGTLVLGHSAVLVGLQPGQLYHYRVHSADAYGNAGVSADKVFSTPSDTTGPVISDVVIDSVTTDSAVVRWNTSEGATSQVQFGPTEAYGSSKPLAAPDHTNAALLVLRHGITLTGLAPGATYHVRTVSKDGFGNQTISGDYVFDTAADETAPVLSTVTAENISMNSAILRWTTDEPATSQVDYGLTPSYSYSMPASPPDHTNPANLRQTHAIVLTGLTAGATYNFRARSKDAFGNEGASSNATFTTQSDTTPPVIGAIAVANIAGDSATIVWSTDERATGQVIYDVDSGTVAGDYANSQPATHPDQSDPANRTRGHTVILSGLAAGQTYYYRVVSRDAFDNEAVSAEGSFTTADTTPPTISAVDAVAVSDEGAVIIWITGEAADSQVVFDTASHAGDYTNIADIQIAYAGATALDTTPANSHGVVLSGLSASTTYYYRVLSVDAAGNEAWSAEYSFTTAA